MISLTARVDFSFNFFLFNFYYKKFSKNSGLVEIESWDKTLPPNPNPSALSTNHSHSTLTHILTQRAHALSTSFKHSKK
jgi:hypothetical protein